MLRVHETLSAMTLGLMVTLVLLSIPSLPIYVGAAEGGPGQGSSPGIASGTDRGTPGKLYEAVSSYVDGIRGKGAQSSEVPAKSRQQRRDPKGVMQPDTETKRMLDTENALAKSRIENQQWDLAIKSLERALPIAEDLGEADTKAELQDMLQTAAIKVKQVSSKRPVTEGEVVNSLGMRLVVIPSGSFVMGSSRAEIRRVQADWNVPEALLEPERPSHTVRITSPFLMGKYDVTANEFKAFVDETGYHTVAEKQGWAWVFDTDKKHWVKKGGASWRNPGFELFEDHPVTFVCRADAEAFCDWLSRKEGRRYHLPTEAQWEYAARGGSDGRRFPWGDGYPDGSKLNMSDKRSAVPWADLTLDDGHSRVAPVGSYEPNGYWLYDMVGNVWQLCADHYDAKAYEKMATSVVSDPVGPNKGKKTVVRGGNWAFGAGAATNAFRFGIDSDLCADICGFRVAAAADAGEAPREKQADKPPQVNVLNENELSRLIDRIKEMVASGRRAEARRLVDQVVTASPQAQLNNSATRTFVKETLDTIIDLTRDKSVKSFVNSLGMTMVRIPSGAFIMGSSETDIGWAMTTLAQGQPVSLENEYPFHKVRISKPFYIGATEVTVKQFRAFVEETGYITDAEDVGGGQIFNTKDSRFEKKDGTSWRNPGWTISDDQPVVMVSWNDAQAYVEWLTAKEKLPYKLPTEAQWEYAARGRLPLAHFPWGDELPDGRRANYADRNTDFEWRDRNADDGYKHVAPVATYEPNGYGLYDMAGNALEWVRDYYGEDYFRYSPEVDPEGPGQGENRVTKGGEWAFGPVDLRCAFRGWSRSDLAFYTTGFRVSIDLGTPLRPFHLADNFLTKEWIPGTDQRAVTLAVAKEKERTPRKAATQSPSASKAVEAEPPLVPGILIIDFSPKSDGKKAGLERGDVIVEYNGTRDLTSEKFLALTARTRKDKHLPTMIILRNGQEYSVKVAKGVLGISIMDTTVRGAVRRPRPEPPRESEPTRNEQQKKTKPRDWT